MKKDKNIELLRVIAAIMVIVLHTSANFVTQKEIDLRFTTGNFFDSFTRYCVPIFILISGYYLLANDKNEDIKYIFKKTYKNIIIPTIIWGMIYGVYNIAIYTLTNKMSLFIAIKKLLIHSFYIVLGKSYYHLWYMYMIIGLYVAVPFIIKFRKMVSSKYFLNITISLLIFGMVNNILSGELFWGIQFINYLGYFMSGYCIREHIKGIQGSALVYICISFLGSFCIFILTELITRKELFSNNLYFYGNLTPIVMLGSISMFIGFVKLNIKAKQIFLVKHTFNLYLIHAGVLVFINKAFERLNIFSENTIIYIISVSIICIAISLVLSSIWIKICDLKISKKIEKKFFYNLLLIKIGNKILRYESKNKEKLHI